MVCFFLINLWTCDWVNGSPEEKLYYAMEMNGQVFGYVELSIVKTNKKGRTLLQLKETVENRLSALGVAVDTQGWSEYRIDPETGRFSFFEQVIDSGSLKSRITASIEGNAARINLQPGGGEKMVSLPAGARVENPYYFPQLLKNPGQDKPGPTAYQVLDVLDRKIHKVTVTKKGLEPLQLAGRTYRAIILESLDHDLGFKFRQWINADNGYLLKSQGPRSTQWLADQSIKDKVQRVNIDKIIGISFFCCAGLMSIHGTDFASPHRGE
jgi:hypothetical protein